MLTKRVIKWLDEEAKTDAEKYDEFFAEHGHCLKEGVATDWQHREALAKLLRFESSFTEKGRNTSLTDYVCRMPEEQTEIYYLLAPNREAAEASPYFEVFREKKYEVLVPLLDPRDEFVMDHLRDFDKKRLVAAEKADVELDKESDAGALSEEDARLLANFIKETLGDRVNEVHSSKRLVGSPAVVVESDTHITSSMRRMMKMMNSARAGPAWNRSRTSKINPDHAMHGPPGKRSGKRDAALAGEVAEQIFDNALVAAGLLEDPRADARAAQFPPRETPGQVERRPNTQWIVLPKKHFQRGWPSHPTSVPCQTSIDLPQPPVPACPRMPITPAQSSNP